MANGREKEQQGNSHYPRKKRSTNQYPQLPKNDNRQTSPVWKEGLDHDANGNAIKVDLTFKVWFWKVNHGVFPEILKIPIIMFCLTWKDGMVLWQTQQLALA